MRPFEVPVQLLIVYFLIHLRFVGMLFTSPLFLATAMPIPFRFLCAALLTMASAGALGNKLETFYVPIVLFESWISIFILALRELMIGTALGLLTALPLTALQVSGEQIGTAMGISMASVMDPLTQRQSSILDQMQFLVGLWFYFRWNGHLLMIQAVVESLSLVPLAKLSLVPASDMALGEWFSGVFHLALEIVIPFYCALLLADVGLGFLARTVPQMNIFVLGLPLKLALGFFVLTLALPLCVDLIYDHIERWIQFALSSATAWR
ncbi:MAG: flagellar biosynthetic protein FliR [Synergistaceae bacterium]|jgi:flagellar biosynthetic protein FliR|nr:flagellar biosynthetic protein FliR [Synergistaceae bacterium]